MPFSRRLTITILSILLLILTAGGLTQSVHAQDPVTIQANIEWVNGPRATIQLQLFRFSDAISVQPVPGDTLRMLDKNTLFASWKGMDRLDPASNLYTYIVKQGSWNSNTGEFDEVPPPNYTSLTEVDGYTFKITNTYVIPKRTVNAYKIWVGGPTTKPTIGFKLYRTSSQIPVEAVPGAIVKDLPSGTTQVTWTDLEATDLAGNAYTFSVREGTWNTGHTVFTEGPTLYYAESYSLDGLTVTNTFTPSVTATKVWINGPTPRPTIWLKLYRQVEGGNPVEVPPLEAPIKELTNGTTTAIWTGQNVEVADGKYYTFSVREVNAQGQTIVPTNYTKSEVGLTVTNAYQIPSNGQFSATKVWVKGATPPPNIALQLYRKTEVMSKAEPVEKGLIALLEGDSSAAWTGLEETDINGLPYRFTIKELHHNGSSTDPKFVDGPPDNYVVNITYSEDLLSAVVLNTFKSDLIDILVTKQWVGGTDPRPTIGFKLYRASTAVPKQPVESAAIEELQPGTLTVAWTGLEKFDENANPFSYSVVEGTWNSGTSEFTEGPPTGYQVAYSVDGLSVTNTYSPPLTTVTAQKVWVNGPATKPTIWFKLYRQVQGGTPEEVPLTEAPVKELPNGTTSVSWQITTIKDPSNKSYTFTVREVNAQGQPFVPTDYTKSEVGLTVTNTYASAQTTVTAQKVWVNGPATKPTIWFKLYRQVQGGTPEEVPLTEAPIKELTSGTISVSWQIDKIKDANNKPYSFSVREGVWNAGTSIFTEGAPQYFTATYSTDGLTVTNTFTPSVTATKVWVNGPAAKPDIWFKLFRQVDNGAPEPVPTTEAVIKKLSNGTTTATWTNQDVDHADGKYYTFSVQEVNEQGQPFVPATYKKTEAGLTVTNTYEIPKNGTASFTKVWVNGPTVKPAVWFKLYRKTTTGIDQEVPVEEAPVTVIPTTAPLKVTWTDLFATDINGNPYTFYIKEGTYNATSKVFTEGLTNYTKTVSTDGFTVTNTYVSPKINVIGYKVWSGGPAAKPNIQIQLYRNGAAFGSPFTLTGNLTSYTWTNVDQTDQNGATYQYTIDEVTVPAYYSKRVNGMTVTNTYTGTVPYTGDNTHNARWLLLLLGFSTLLPLVQWVDLKLLTRRRG